MLHQPACQSVRMSGRHGCLDVALCAGQATRYNAPHPETRWRTKAQRWRERENEKDRANERENKRENENERKRENEKVRENE